MTLEAPHDGAVRRPRDGAGAGEVGIVVAGGSVLRRRAVRTLLAADPRFVVLGEARTRADLLALTGQNRPAAVVLDPDLPQGALSAIAELMATHPVPVVVYGDGELNRPAVQADLRAAGAVDVVVRPPAEPGAPGRAAAEEELRACLLVAARIRVIRHPRGRLMRVAAQRSIASPLIVIGASTGGPSALGALLGAMPTELRAAVLVVQHMPVGFVSGLAGWLNGCCPLPVTLGRDGDLLHSGEVLVCPGGKDSYVEALDNAPLGRLCCVDPESQSHHVPSVDRAFASVAATAGPRAIGVLLTGMGRDGAAGMAALHDAGAATIAQDESTSAIYGMPQAAVAAGAVDHILPLPEIAATLADSRHPDAWRVVTMTPSTPASAARVPATDVHGQIAELVRVRAGLVVDSVRRDVLAGLVAERARQLGLPDASAYLERLHLDSSERQALIEGLTIGETYFSRNPPQIHALAELVLPALIARGDRRLRIWSAGCSTGEEAYTLALLLTKLLPDGGHGWDARIIATDINTAALATARNGRYGTRAVSLLSDDELNGHFERDGNGWRVNARLRELVEFRQHNLAHDPPPAGRLDLILCRNVLIYFDRPQMLDVINRMHNALAPGGWLLLGHSETLWRLYDGFTLVRHGDAFLYRRQPEARPAVRRPPPLRRPIAVPAARRASPVDDIREALTAGAYGSAAELAAAHLEVEPLAADVHYLHGLALVETGDDDRALVALRRAAYLDPSSGFAQFLLAVVLGRLGHGAESARAYGAAAAALARRGPDERATELGGRRVEDSGADVPSAGTVEPNGSK